MKPRIADIQCFPLRVSLTRSIGFSQWYYNDKNNLLVKVVTDTGVVGWGECYGPNLAITTAILDHLKSRLLGENPMENEVLWNLMWKAFLDFNRKGIMMAAISGLDIALWDIKGKILNTPVRTLLGGSSSSVPCYATGMYYRNDKPEGEMLEELLDEAAEYVDRGYKFLKVKVGKNMEFDRRLIKAFRDRFPDIILAADSNHAYNFKEAIAIGKELEKYDYAWFEEPVSPENYDDMAKLRSLLTIPISAGECEQTRFGFMQLAKGQCLDIFQPDLAYCGGITEFQKIAGLASAFHVDVVPHCWGLRINQAVAASCISTLHENPGRFERRPIYLEMDQTEHPVRDSIFVTAHEVRNGEFHFNDLPGLGVVVDEAKLQEYVIPHSGGASGHVQQAKL